MKKQTQIKKLVKNTKKFVKSSKTFAMELIQMIPNRKDTLKYMLMFDFGYEDSELEGLTTKELSALVISLRAHQKMMQTSMEMLKETNNNNNN